jgi:phenylacetate-CoA ligase
MRSDTGRTPLEDWIRGRLHVSGRLNPAQLREYQAAKLRETLDLVVSRSRFYREYLGKNPPSSVRNIGDVTQLPFTESRMISEHFNDFLCVSPQDIGRIVTLSTSGTTGRPKRIAFTPEDQELIVEFFHHGMTTFADSSDRVVIFLPGEIAGSVGDLLKKGLSRFGCESVVAGPVTDCGRAVKMLADTKATCAVGIPSQFLELSRHGNSGSTVEPIRLRSVLLSTDYVARAVADSLEQAWDCAVYNHYGMTEMGLGGAVECSARNGYHMREADLLFEIIDPDTGTPVPDGEYGEVVFSTLTRRGMPLIRYRTGDRSRFLTQPCPCGSVLRRLECISGRMHEPVRLQSGTFISITQLDEVLLRNPCVAAFSAEIGPGEDCECLALTIRSATGEFDAGNIASDLCRQLPIGDLVNEGKLKLDIREGDVGYFTTGTAKRFIADRRR